MGNFSGERKTCTSENSLQKLSKKPNKHKCLKTKNTERKALKMINNNDLIIYNLSDANIRKKNFDI